MSAAGANVTMFMQTATYPLHLFLDAVYLRDQAAAKVADRSDDGRNLPTPGEFALSRAAIFTAFNFLESLLIELSQDAAASGPHKGTATAQTILEDLRQGRASISRTMKEWPLALTGTDVTADHRFRHFKEIRGFRNQLIHPKFEPLEQHELTQDQLLLRANAAEAAWVFGQIALMATVLYTVFKKPVPPEVAAEAGKAPKHPPARR